MPLQGLIANGNTFRRVLKDYELDPNHLQSPAYISQAHSVFPAFGGERIEGFYATAETANSQFDPEKFIEWFNQQQNYDKDIRGSRYPGLKMAFIEYSGGAEIDTSGMMIRDDELYNQAVKLAKELNMLERDPLALFLDTLDLDWDGQDKRVR